MAIRKKLSRLITTFTGIEAAHFTDINHAAGFASPTGEDALVAAAESAPTLVTDGVACDSARYVVWTTHTPTVLTSYAIQVWVMVTYSGAVKWAQLMDEAGNLMQWTGLTAVRAVNPIAIAGFERCDVIMSALVGTSLRKAWKVI